MLSVKDWVLVKSIDCEACENKDMCEQIKYECPMADFDKLEVTE